MAWFALLIGAVAVERLAELAVARRNRRWSMRRGGVEHGRGHYLPMVALHTGLLVAALLEAGLLGRPFIAALGWPMLALVVAAQALRWWCVRALGPRWNTRVIVVAGLPRVVGGPYRLLAHPNYVAVAVEGFALPLVRTAWITAVAFTALNALLLRVRVGVENRALQALEPA